MLQQPLSGADPPPSAVRPKKVASRKPAPAPDPFPTYRQTQATIKALRAELSDVKKHLNMANTIASEHGKAAASYERELRTLKKKYSDLAAKNAALQTQIRTYGDMLYEQMAGQAGKSAIPSDMLGRLIRLAHPDKHNNSTAANEATSWLLKQR